MPARLLMDEGTSATHRTSARSPVPARGGCACDGSHRRPGGHECIRGSDAIAGHAGQFQAEWTAEKPGTYLAEVTAESRRQPAAGIGSRRADIPARRRRRGELPHRAEPSSARATRIANRRALLEAVGSEESAAGHLVLRSRHLRAQHEGALEYADRLSRSCSVCPLPSGCCAASGVSYEARSLLLAMVLALHCRRMPRPIT